MRYASVLLIVSVLAGCTGAPGEAFLAYSWASAPLSLYDDNPSVPDTVTNGEYVKTGEGSFYMEYTAWDGSGWWMTYTITAKPGEAMFQDGADAYFEISLYSFGPSFYEWSYPRELTAAGEGEDGALQPDRGSEKMASGGFVMEMEYGPLEE
ncbi:MAG: hypothetical protein R6V86_07760 [Spirochaetia bacterium]